MKSTLVTIGNNVLLVLTVFIAFVLLFENKLVIPVWLQPVGRLHPMILHFPISLLLLVMISRILILTKKIAAGRNVQLLMDNLLLAGALLSGVAVIMGLFLSKEEGYEQNTLLLHKWTGAIVFLLSSIVYFFRREGRLKSQVEKVAGIAIILCIISAGHYGAVLTHGEDYVMSPLRNLSAPVALDEAVVFRDVIKPVLEGKCTSCHNEKKVKGELILSDYEALLKGGKSGKLFEPGDPQTSLLIKRIHLPESDKKRMPPAGKADLTDDERDLFYYWVKSNVSHDLPVISLPLHDSLRIIAASMLSPPADPIADLDLTEADKAVIERLNSNYRVVTPLSSGSPAVSVSFYNPEQYSPAALKELLDIGENIVSLDLNKMPVTDADIGTIVKFRNLMSLNLSFTELTENGITRLKELTKLRTLSLAGTRLTLDAANAIAASSKLQKLTVWSTILSASPLQVDQLQKKFTRVEIVDGFKDDSTVNMLNTPKLHNPFVVFDSSMAVDIRHPIAGVDVRYTTDGTDPDNIRSPVLSQKMPIRESTVIKARAYKSGWAESDVVTFKFYRSTYKPDSIRFLSRPSLRYRGDYSNQFYQVLFDKKLGDFILDDFIFNLNSGQWLGFRENPVELLLHYKEPVKISSVGLHTVIITGRSVFPPSSIEIWGGASANNLRLLSVTRPAIPKTYGLPETQNFISRFGPVTASYIRIVAKPLESIPAWHRDKGKTALSAIDEIFIN